MTCVNSSRPRVRPHDFDGGALMRELDAPAAIVVTTRDHVVPPRAQLEAAALIEGASVYEVDGGHTVCARQQFAEPLVDACRDVAGAQPGDAGESRPAWDAVRQSSVTASTSSASAGAIPSAIAQGSSTISGQITMPMSIESR